jgi:phosphodiesterase/alkaline phosphatase D-like protein
MSRRLVVAAAALLALVAAVPANAEAPAATTGTATSVGARSAIVDGLVDPGGESTSWYVEYGTATAYGTRTGARSAGNGTSAVDVSQQLTGLATGVTYHYRLVATNAAGTSRGADQAFTTRGAPEVRTGAAASIGPAAASLGGTVDPNGRSTGWWIEYGTTTRYGNRTDTRSAGAGVSPVAVAVRIGGLTAGETYHFRLVAANDIGTTAGADIAFRTDSAPSVATDGADSITVSSARISGRVDPRGRGTVAWFEFGPTAKLGSRTGDLDAGFARGASTHRAPIGGLQPGTSYHYRIGARSDAGTTYGQIRVFRTSAGPLATTGAATPSGLAVTLTGTVDPVGRSTGAWFELGTTTSYGTRTVVRPVGSGRGAVAVSETVTGLAAGTEYHVRLVAQSTAGTTHGADLVFRTAGLPTVGRASASAISLAGALIRADVSTGGLETQVWVEFGRGGSLTARTDAVRLPASASTTGVSFRLTGLAPGRRYGFRVVAASAAGTATGSSASFETASWPRDERGRVLRCTIAGTNGPDRLVGTWRRDVICGLGGADMLVGLGRDDVLVGGPGADYLRPGAGRDRILCGPGDDFVAARDGRADLVVGGDGHDRGRLDRRLDESLSVTRIR